MAENLIIFNARVVTPTGFSARKGREMAEVQVLENATVEVTDGLITYVGPNRGESRDGYYQHYWHYNARGRCVLPGFVDSHTHFVFGGERAEEFSWRLRGESYMSIMRRGGGVIVCPGVKIGCRCVIGAGSVVTHDIPDDSVAAGNPARVIRTATDE